MKSPPVPSTIDWTSVASERTPGSPTAYTCAPTERATAVAEAAVAVLEMSAPSVRTTIAFELPVRPRSSWLA